MTWSNATRTERQNEHVPWQVSREMIMTMAALIVIVAMGEVTGQRVREVV
jgi:hypothetical protein